MEKHLETLILSDKDLEQGFKKFKSHPTHDWFSYKH